MQFLVVHVEDVQVPEVLVVVQIVSEPGAVRQFTGFEKLYKLLETFVVFVGSEKYGSKT